MASQPTETTAEDSAGRDLPTDPTPAPAEDDAATGSLGEATAEASYPPLAVDVAALEELLDG
ncbi:MAG TPA: hypothetical protein VD859_08485, partial [Nocardioides sp.]|nr:hypothetical protein [Nocardioides sp.]